MKVIAYGPRGIYQNEGYPTPRAHDAFFAAADAITLHCPLTPETRHFINADTLKRMKPGAVLINTGRGDLVNEAALIHCPAIRGDPRSSRRRSHSEPPTPTIPSSRLCRRTRQSL
jgi:phosphoglycerate dehydrogenase-like enzyme